jgi:hypothetical protein
MGTSANARFPIFGANNLHARFHPVPKGTIETAARHDRFKTGRAMTRL